MMTEAEALKTLAREEPAVADDVRHALRRSHRRRPRSHLAAAAAGIPLVRAARWKRGSQRKHLAVARALARLFTLAGMERYAETCASEETSQIITRTRARGPRAWPLTPGRSHLARRAAGHRPARLVLGDGARGRAAYDACAAATRAAVAATS